MTSNKEIIDWRRQAYAGTSTPLTHDTITRGPSPAAIVESVEPKARQQLLTDYLALKNGVNLKRRPSVEAQELAGIGSQGVMHAFKVVARFTRYDLSYAANEVISRVIADYPPPTFRQLARHIQARDYRKTELAVGSTGASGGGTLGTRVNEAGELKEVNLNIGLNETYQLHRHGIIEMISPEILADEPAWVRQVPATLLSAMHTSEAAECFAALENNKTMTDGKPVYAIGTNEISEPAFDLGRLLQLFRDQRHEGGFLLNYEPRNLVVPSKYELAAQTALHQAGLTDKIDLHVRSGLSAAYLLADSARNPTLFRPAFSPDDSNALEVKPPHGDDYAGRGDWLAARIQASFDYIIGSRYGLVRMLLP